MFVFSCLFSLLGASYNSEMELAKVLHICISFASVGDVAIFHEF